MSIIINVRRVFFREFFFPSHGALLFHVTILLTGETFFVAAVAVSATSVCFSFGSSLLIFFLLFLLPLSWCLYFELLKGKNLIRFFIYIFRLIFFDVLYGSAWIVFMFLFPSISLNFPFVVFFSFWVTTATWSLFSGMLSILHRFYVFFSFPNRMNAEKTDSIF